jgi:hypothetical protein
VKNDPSTIHMDSLNSVHGNRLSGQGLTAVKKQDYLLASMIFVGYLVAALVVVVIISLIGGGTALLGFFVGVLFTAGVYQTWKNMLGRSRTRNSQAQP